MKHRKKSILHFSTCFKACVLLLIVFSFRKMYPGAVTKNLYRDNFPGFTVNVQTGEARPYR